MPILYETILGIVVVLILLYYYFAKCYEFWRSRGVPGPKPIPPFGNVFRIMFGKQSIPDYQMFIRKQFPNEPMVGIYERARPALILQDADHIKEVLIKNFTKFEDRGFPMTEKADPLSAHLFSLEGTRWRPLRTQFTPVFTSGKLRGFYSLILECANHMEEYLDSLINKDDAIDVRELVAKYTTDVIGSCAFGVEVNSLSDKDNKFREVGKDIFDPNLFSTIKWRLQEWVPTLFDFLCCIFPYDDTTRFITSFTTDSINYRIKNNITRPDFINILTELKKHPEKVGDLKLTDTLLAAQAYVFFAAGFETSSTSMSHTLYELARNHDIQDKLREEIVQCNSENNGNWTYEGLKGMVYLQKVIDESLRKYPVLPTLTRDATSEYTFTDTKVTIPPGTKLWIPVYAIHRDPRIYPDPEKFDPERFSENMTKARHQMHYLPFGHGPRNCIGSRFAIIQMKLGLIKILLNHKVDVCEKTLTDYVIHPLSFALLPTEPFYLKLTRVEN